MVVYDPPPQALVFVGVSGISAACGMPKTEFDMKRIILIFMLAVAGVAVRAEGYTTEQIPNVQVADRTRFPTVCSVLRL